MRTTGWYLGGLLLAMTGCSSDTTTTDIVTPTVMAIEPEGLPGMNCSPAPGGVKSYVATMVDTTPYQWSDHRPLDLCSLDAAADGDLAANPNQDYGWICKPFPLPSSPPQPCNLPVGFGNVPALHRYIARVDGYQETGLVPAAVGSPLLLDPNNGMPVDPSWVWVCDEDTLVAPLWTVFAQGCHLLSKPTQVDGTFIYLDLSALPASLLCGSQPGQIASISVVPQAASGPSPERQDTLGCKADAVFAARPGVAYTFAVEAYTTGQNGAKWTTTCSAIAQDRTTIPATCHPLQPVD